MRTIKFKTYDKEAKRMLSAKPLHSFNVDIYANLPSRYEIMQFTGVLDKNGKEIFTGDILQGVGGVKFQVFDGKGGFSINTFQDELTTGYTSVNALADPQTLGYIEGNTEIIGNIYENPELLTN